MDKKLNIVIVDDDTCFSVGLQAILQKDFKARIDVRHVLSGEEFFETIKVQKPEVIYLDVKMRGMSGAEVALRLRELHPGIKIIAASDSREKEDIAAMIDADVDAYVLKEDYRTDMVNALQQVLQGHLFYSDKIRHIVKEIGHDQHHKTDLVEKANKPTPAEELMIIFEAAGYTRKEMAEKRNTDTGTINTHFNNLNTKNLNSSRKRLLYALEHKLIKDLDSLRSL